jgi:hypothetical protein
MKGIDMSKKSTQGDGSHGKGKKGIAGGPESGRGRRGAVLQALRSLTGLIWA